MVTNAKFVEYDENNAYWNVPYHLK